MRQLKKLLPVFLMLCLPGILPAQDTAFLARLEDYYRSGRFREGLALCAEVLRDSAMLDAQTMCRVLVKKGVFLKDTDQIIPASQVFAQAKSILEEKGDTLSPLFCEVLQYNSALAASSGKFDLSEQLSYQAYALAERVLDRDDPLFALAVFHKGFTHFNRRQYALADSLLLEAAALQERILGEHVEYAQTLHILGINYGNMYVFPSSDKYLNQARQIRQKVFAYPHPLLVRPLISLGANAGRSGKLEEAEIYFRQCIPILKSLDQYGQGMLTVTQYNLSNLLSLIGQFQKARELLLENIELVGKVRGTNHPDYPMNLAALASTYFKEGQFDHAERLFLEALPMWEKILGRSHPYYCLNLSNIGEVNLRQKNWARAIAYLSEACACYRQLEDGNTNPNLAYAMEYLSEALFQNGQLDAATEQAEAAYAKINEIFPGDHIQQSRIGTVLALLYKASGNQEKAAGLTASSFDISRRLLLRASAYYSESDLESSIFDYSQDLSRQLAALSPWPSRSAWPDETGLHYDGMLFYKGFVTQNINQLRTYILQSPDTTLQATWQQWQDLQRRIGQEYARPAQLQSKDLGRWEEEAGALEKSLVRQAAEFGRLRREVRWQDVQKQLGPRDAAIEFLKYTPDPWNPEAHYAAALLRPGWAHPQVVYLCPEASLQALWQGPEAAGAPASRGIEPIAANIPRALYQLLWQPLDTLLRGVRTVYYAPAGLLHTLPLHALPLDKGKQLLCDRYDLVLMSSTRNLTETPVAHARPQKALLVGGVNYNQIADDPDKPAPALNAAAQRSQTVLRSMRPASGEAGWLPLPGSKEEVRQIGQILEQQGIPARMLLDSAATEAAVKTILFAPGDKPDLLHFATHGFAFSDTSAQPRFHYALLQNPLLRAGLVLAGANQSYGANAKENREDGILTAFEITGSNLYGVRLVALSACNSGLGAIRQEEGVFGLSRAFRIAGAQNLLLSLWEAPDAETAEFMTQFYRRWLKGAPMREAFWKTRSAMRKKYTALRQWAGFILLE